MQQQLKIDIDQLKQTTKENHLMFDLKGLI